VESVKGGEKARLSEIRRRRQNRLSEQKKNRCLKAHKDPSKEVSESSAALTGKEREKLRDYDAIIERIILLNKRRGRFLVRGGGEKQKGSPARTPAKQQPPKAGGEKGNRKQMSLPAKQEEKKSSSTVVRNWKPQKGAKKL